MNHFAFVQATPTVEERSTQFVPVEGGGETTSAEALLVSAYIAIWLLLMAFLYATFRRQRRINARLNDIERSFDQAEQGGK